MNTTIKLGSFQVESGKLRISDPCYGLNTWCAGTLENVSNGEWVAEIKMTDGSDRCGKRVVSLRAYKLTYENVVRDHKSIPFKIGVDSGQAGIFDLKHFKCSKDAIGQEQAAYITGNDEGRDWYAMCCAKTYSESKGKDCHQAGVIPFGVVSSSGFGDGSYEGTYAEDTEGKIIEVNIPFIPDDDQEDYDDAEEDDDENEF